MLEIAVGVVVLIFHQKTMKYGGVFATKRSQKALKTQRFQGFLAFYTEGGKKS
jgi:hypothetical protein